MRPWLRRESGGAGAVRWWRVRLGWKGREVRIAVSFGEGRIELEVEWFS